MSDIAQRFETIERRLDVHDDHIARLDADMAEIRETLGQTATKADVTALRTHLDGLINGVLRDAMNAIPARWTTIFVGLGAMIATATYFISLNHHGN